MYRSSKILICSILLFAILISVFSTGCGDKANSSSTVETTTKATTQPQTTTQSVSTEDTPTQPATWNYSKLKQKADLLNSDFDNIIKKKKFKGVLYIKVGNDFEYIGKNGFSNKDKHKKNSLDTCYRVASITKQFTATAIMQLKEKGKISLDTTINKYYPNYKYGKKITIKNLLTMTSGIKDYLNINGNSDTQNYAVTIDRLPYNISKNNSAKENKKTIMNWIFSHKLDFEPDEEYAYSNSSYFILGDIIEKVSGISYEKYITNNILKPAGMKSSGFKADNNLAIGYQDVYGNDWQLYPGVAYSAAGLISNVPDLLKWIEALCNNQLISEESFEEMTTPYKEDYGYGFMINDKSVYHTGRIDKYNSSIIFTKDQNQIGIALSNYSQSDIQEIFRLIFNKLSPYYG